MYDAVWNLVRYTDENDIEEYVAALSTVKPDESMHAEQRTGDIVELYLDATSVQAHCECGRGAGGCPDLNPTPTHSP